MDSAVPVIQLLPGSGLVGLPFGTSRLDVREFFGAPQSSEQSSIGMNADQWPGVTAHFSSDERLQALELSSPRDCMLDGTMISALGFEAAVALLREQDQQTISHSDATHFVHLSMTVCRASYGTSEEVTFVLDGGGCGEWWAIE